MYTIVQWNLIVNFRAQKIFGGVSAVSEKMVFESVTLVAVDEVFRINDTI